MEAAARDGRLRPAAALIPVSLSLTGPTGPGCRRTRCCSHKSGCRSFHSSLAGSSTRSASFENVQDTFWAVPAGLDAFDDRRLAFNPTREPSSLCGAAICFSLSNSDVPSLPARLSKLPVLQDHLDPADKRQKPLAGL